MKKQYYRKPHRIKRKKSIFKNKFFWLGILIFIMAAGLVYFLIFSSFFEVKEIKIFGNDKLNQEAIENLIQEKIQQDFKFFKNKNINLIDLGEIDKALLENFPQIAKISSKKDLPNTLEIEIEERKPVAIFEQNNKWFFTDKEGVIFQQINEETATQTAEQMAIIQNLLLNRELKLGEMIAEKEIITQILDLESKFKDQLKITIREMIIASEGRLNVKTSENWEAYFNLKGDLNWQFTELKTVLEKKVPPEKRGNIIYIDLRFDRVYIFPETYSQ